MSKQSNKPMQRPLRLISPKLYTYITEELQQLHNIHSYDLQLDAIPGEKGIHVIICFGATFSHKKEQFFTHEQIDEIHNEVKSFVKDTGEACKQVLIDDYFKIHAP